MKERGNKVLRALDKYVGIPLVLLLGLLRRRKKRMPDVLALREPGFTLVLTGAIGDTILFSGVVRELRINFPGARITLICSAGNRTAAGMIGGISEIRLFDMLHPVRSVLALRKLEKSDFLFDFAAWTRINSIISYFTPAGFKIGFRRNKTFRHSIYDIAVAHSDLIHEIDNYRNILKAASIPVRGLLPKLTVDEENKGAAIALLRNKRANIVIHPFAGGYKKHLKAWPDTCWAELCTRLLGMGCHIYISGSKADIGGAEAIQSRIRVLGGTAEVIAGRYTLGEMAAILEAADLLITIDTGLMHLGAAVDARLIALHGPTAPSRWGAVSAGAVSMNIEMPCSPCISIGFESGCKNNQCMSCLSIDDVYAKAAAILEESVVARQCVGGEK